MGLKSWLFSTSGVLPQSSDSVTSSFTSWLLDLEGKGPFQPLEWFGFGLKGEGSNRAWSFMGLRTSGGNTIAGRVWVPDPQKPWSKAGRWGSAGEFNQAVRTAWRTAPTMANKVKRTAGMIGGKLLLPAFAALDFGSRFSRYTAQGDNAAWAGVKAAAGVGAEGVAWSLAARAIMNPWTALAAVPLAVGVGMMLHKQKMGEYAKQARRSEFVGDMSAFNTRAANTMRQRSMNAIQRSYLHTRRALGEEAQYMHMDRSRMYASNPSVWG